MVFINERRSGERKHWSSKKKQKGVSVLKIVNGYVRHFNSPHIWCDGWCTLIFCFLIIRPFEILRWKCFHICICTLSSMCLSLAFFPQLRHLLFLSLFVYCASWLQSFTSLSCMWEDEYIICSLSFSPIITNNQKDH